MALKGKPVAIGNTATTIYTCPATKEAAVHGLLFGNNTASVLTVDVIVYNQATGSDVTVVTDLAVPANGVATWSKPINLNAGDAVKAISSTASGMVCLYSTYEDGATPVASGFTARGAWSSAASYVANDIVSVTGIGTYVAIQASTNQNPTTATAYWMFLEGISASALPVQAGNAGKYLTTDGSDASWGEIDSSSLSVAMDVNASGSVTQNTVVNFASDGTIGVNPVANSLTTPNTITGTYNLASKDGECILDYEFDGTNSKVRTSVRDANGDYGAYSSWTTIVTPSLSTTAEYGYFKRLNNNTFYASIGSRNGGGGSATAKYSWRIFTVNLSTGAITLGQTMSDSTSNEGGQTGYLYYGRSSIGSDIPNIMYTTRFRGSWAYGQNTYDYYAENYSNINSISRTSQSISMDTSAFFLHNMSDNKTIAPRENTSWAVYTWNGSIWTAETSFTYDSDGTGAVRAYRPSTSQDYLVYAFRNAGNKLILKCGEWNGTNLTVDYSETVLEAFTGGEVTSLVGDSTGFVVSWRYDSRAYAQTFEYDLATNTVTGSGIPKELNTDNRSTYIEGPNGSDEYSAVYIDGASNSVTSTFTANSYNTVNLNAKGISTQTVSGGGQANVIVRGVVSGLSGLTQGAVYYYNTDTYDGTLTTTVTTQRVGTAISDTELLIDGL